MHTFKGIELVSWAGVGCLTTGASAVAREGGVCSFRRQLTPVKGGMRSQSYSSLDLRVELESGNLWEHAGVGDRAQHLKSKGTKFKW